MKYLRYFFIAVVFVLTGSCNSGLKSEEVGFVNPIITTGDFFSGSNWNDPHVLYDGTQFVMYASASAGFDGNVKIFRLVSDNGINWNLSPQGAVLERSSGGWDSSSVETPAVVFYDGKYHMFYTGYSGLYHETQYFKIGHAVSTDGILWTKDSSFLLEPTDPLGAPSLEFNQFIVAEPGPVVFNNKLYLYFTALGANSGVGTTLEVIGLTVFDGSSWSVPLSVLEPDQSLYPRDSYVGYSTPNAVVIDGNVHLYVDVVADPWKQVGIHHAVSPDGISDWTQDSDFLLTRDDFSWTEEELRSPSALLYNGELYLYFAGHKGYDLGIGLQIF